MKNKKQKRIIIKIFLTFFSILVILIIPACNNLKSLSNFNADTEHTQSEQYTESTSVDAYEDSLELFFNIKNKQKDKNLLNNINVRKAIFYSIDRERIVNELFKDKNDVLNSLFNENSFFSDPLWHEIKYDKEKAKEYLKNAGYGIENPLYLTIGSNSSSDTRQKIEEIIKENLEEIGIKIWISNYPSNEWYNNYVRQGNYELALWSIYTSNPDDLLNYFSSLKIPVNETIDNQNCNNFYWYSNETVDENLQKLILTKNISDKKEIIDILQKKIYEDSFILPLFSRLFVIAFDSNIENLKIDPANGNFLSSLQNIRFKNSKEDDSIKEIIIGTDNMPTTMNPFLESNVYMDYINSIIVRGLWKPGNDGIYTADLIDEGKSQIRINKTDNSIFITLRQDIFWQDGTRIDSGDVKATIDSIIADDSLGNKANEFNNIKEIKILSDTEFYVYFNDPIQNYEKLFTFILPERLIKEEKISNLLMEDTFGSGPFQMTEWVKDKYMILERNMYYRGNKSEVNKIKIIFNTDKNVLISMLKNGDMDILSIPVDIDLINELNESKNTDVLIEKGNLWEHLAICLKPVE